MIGVGEEFAYGNVEFRVEPVEIGAGIRVDPVGVQNKVVIVDGYTVECPREPLVK